MADVQQLPGDMAGSGTGEEQRQPRHLVGNRGRRAGQPFVARLRAAPGSDRGALESDVRGALKRRAVRSAASAEARLGRNKFPHG